MSNIHFYKKAALAVAVASLASGTAQAQSSKETDVQVLKGTVEDLRKQLIDLRELLQQRGIAASTPNTQGQDVSQEQLDANTPASKADVQGLRTDLENYKYDKSREYERNTAKSTRDTKIGGSLSIGYQSRSNPINNGTAGTSGGDASYEPLRSGFDAPAFGLNFTGNLYRDYKEGLNLDYRLAFSSSNSPSASTSTLNLSDAYVRYKVLPDSNAEDNRLTVTLGQQIIPFGQEAQAIDPEVKAIISNLPFVSGLGLGTRQLGVVVSGDYDPYVDFTNNYRAPLFAYSLGLFGGNGANRVDNNNALDLVGRVIFSLPVDYSSWLRQLQVGGSFYQGRTSLSSYDTATPGSTTGTTPSLQGRAGTNTRKGVDVNWTHLPYSVSYEYAEGQKELWVGDSTHPDGKINARGQYVNFGYTWGEQFLSSSKQQGKFDDYWPKSYQTFLRFDKWEPDTAISKGGEFTTTLGLNIFFAETSKVQVNYQRKNYELGSATPTTTSPTSRDTLQILFNASF